MVLQPHPILFSTAIGTVYTHGLLFAMGAFTGIGILLLQRRFLVLRASFLIERSAWIFLLGIFAARAGYLITYPSAWQDASQLFAIWQGGLISYWGIAGGGLVARAAAQKMEPAQRIKWYGVLTVAVLIAWGVGRFGNYFADDSVGVLSAHWAFFYGRIPIQFFESLLCFAIGIWGYRNVQKDPMRVLWCSWIAYFAGRTIIDTWRDEAALGPFHVSQLFSLATTVILYVIWRKRYAK